MPAAEQLAQGLRRLGPLLAAWPFPAAVIGGIAIIARVSPRHTDDIDVVVTVPDGRADDFLNVAMRHGFSHDPDETRELLEGGLMRLFLAPSPAEDAIGLDILVVDSAFLATVVARATAVDLGFCTLPVASVEDLLLLKLEANRPEDVEDILSIKDALAPTLDMGYVRTEAARLSLTAALELYFGPA